MNIYDSLEDNFKNAKLIGNYPDERIKITDFKACLL